MNQILLNLYLHQAWADAEQFKALESFPSAREDGKILKTIHHIYEAQKAFLLIVKKIPLEKDQFGNSYDFQELKKLSKTNHENSVEFIKTVTEEMLGEIVSIPWFKNLSPKITVEQALTQAVMHSQYHRGQNAARLRELGGEPPLTDFILWLLKEKPVALW